MLSFFLKDKVHNGVRGVLLCSDNEAQLHLLQSCNPDHLPPSVGMESDNSPDCHDGNHSSLLTPLISVDLSTKLLIGSPFLLADWKSYMLIAYDVRRTFLWEKTRNFKFVGRIMYDSKWFVILSVPLATLTTK